MDRSYASSSMDSSNNPPSSPSSSSSSICHSSNYYLTNRMTTSVMRARRDLSTDLSLGFSISSPQSERRPIWPPFEQLPESTPAGSSAEDRQQGSTSGLYVKVYMEGFPIGRKLDLLSHDGYDVLAGTLAHMFKATILCGKGNRATSHKYYVLTYQDRDGDWMVVGDVPWEIFKSTVKRLKITRADRC